MSEKYTTLDQRVSYGIGRQMGKQLAGNPLDEVDIDAVVAGLIGGFKDEPSEIEPEVLKASFEEINQILQERQAEAAKGLSAEGEKTIGGASRQRTGPAAVVRRCHRKSPVSRGASQLLLARLLGSTATCRRRCCDPFLTS